MKIVSIVVAVVFILQNTVCAIDMPHKTHLRVPLIGNNQQSRYRFKEALFNQIRQILSQIEEVDKEKDLEFYGKTKRALLLESGKIILDKELYAKYTSGDLEKEQEALQVIIHEMIEALLQVIKKEQPSRYASIKEIALNHLAGPDKGDKPYRDESLANDIWATVFEHRLTGTKPEDITNPELKTLLAKGYEMINKRGDLFGKEFNNLCYAKETVVEGVRKGIDFYKSAKTDDREVYTQSSSISRQTFLRFIGTGLLWLLAIVGCEKLPFDADVKKIRKLWPDKYPFEPTESRLVKGCDGVSMMLHIDASAVPGTVDPAVFDLLEDIFNHFPLGMLPPEYIESFGVALMKPSGEIEDAHGAALAKSKGGGMPINPEEIFREETLADFQEKDVGISVDGKLIINYTKFLRFNEEKNMYELPLDRRFALYGTTPYGFVDVVAHELFHFIQFNLIIHNPQLWAQWKNLLLKWLGKESRHYIILRGGELFAEMGGQRYFINTKGFLEESLKEKKKQSFLKLVFFIAELFAHNDGKVTWVFEVIEEGEAKPIKIIAKEYPVIRNEQGEIIDIDFEEPSFTSTQIISPIELKLMDRAGFLSLLIPGLKSLRAIQSGI